MVVQFQPGDGAYRTLSHINFNPWRIVGYRVAFRIKYYLSVKRAFPNRGTRRPSTALQLPLQLVV